MRRFFFTFGVFILLAGGLPARAAQSQAGELSFKKKGFFLGGEFAGLIGFGDGEVVGAPGKLSLLAGYQVNPYFSFAADLWTFWFVAYVAELQVKANFLDRKVSPYAVASVGGGVLLNVFDDEGDSSGFLTYSAGLGVDFHLWRKGTLFTQVKYRGSRFLSDEEWSTGHGMEFGVGYRHLF